MRKIILILSTIALLMPLYGDAPKTSADFAPPPESEAPLTGLIPSEFSPQWGLGLSATATLGAFTLTAIGTYKLINAVAEDPSGVEVPQRAVQTGTALICTGLFAILTDHFLDRILLTSEE